MSGRKPASDHEIVASFQSGARESAFRLLYEQYAGQLLSVALRYMGDDAEAHDVLQDALISAYKALDKFEVRDEGTLYYWLRRIVVNRALTQLSSYHYRHITPLDEEQCMEVEEEEADEGYEMPDSETLMTLIQKLPEGYRTVLNLYAIEGYSHKEIAEMLGIKERSSASQYHRAKQKLKEEIERWRKKGGI